MVDKTELHGVILSVLSERWELSATLPTAKVKRVFKLFFLLLLNSFFIVLVSIVRGHKRCLRAHKAKIRRVLIPED